MSYVFPSDQIAESYHVRVTTLKEELGVRIFPFTISVNYYGELSSLPLLSTDLTCEIIVHKLNKEELYERKGIVSEEYANIIHSRRYEGHL